MIKKMSIKEYSEMKKLNTPVLFLIFNRPNTTKKVFEEIRKAKPKKLFIAADGPRKNVPEDRAKCEKARKITQGIDWDCKVKRLFRTKNLGCKYAVSSAIDWFFENVEEGIILEDDCLPSQSFFWFCQDLLEKYKYDNRIMQINGNNYGNILNTKNSYSFCSYSQVWGWATWRRVWVSYDVNLTSWKQMSPQLSHLPLNWNKPDLLKEKQRGNAVFFNNFDTWDYQLHFIIFFSNGLVIAPKYNLVRNIGFGNNATHTKNRGSKMNLPVRDIKFPLNHPLLIFSDKGVNEIYKRNMLGKNKYLSKLPEIIFLHKELKRLKTRILKWLNK